MSLVDPCSPMSNTIIFYIIIIITLVILKPEIMYCHKTNQFKAFGYGKNSTEPIFFGGWRSMGLITRMYVFTVFWRKTSSIRELVNLSPRMYFISCRKYPWTKCVRPLQSPLPGI